MGTHSSSTSTQYRPSCRGIRFNCSKVPRRRLRKRSDLEPRRREAMSGFSIAPAEGVTGRAMVIGPYRRRRAAKGHSPAADVERPPEARLDEAVGLARAIDLDVVESGIAPLSDIRPATYIGKGKVDELAGLIRSEEIGVVVMDCALSPVQQRNLET